MEQQQDIAYQMDLFQEQVQGAIRPSDNRETVCGAKDRKALQVKRAGEQERTLTVNLLRTVKQFKETAVYESMPGGMRGRGSNPPTYSIMNLPLTRDKIISDFLIFNCGI